MKKVLFIVALSLFAIGAFAQTEKGKFRIGGDANVGFASTKLDGASNSNTDLNLGVEAGYFVIDNLSINAGLLLGYEKIGGDDDATNTYGLQLGARYYLPSKIFFGAAFDVISSKYGSYDSQTGTGLTLGAGYALFLNDKVAFEPSIGYRLGLSDKDKGTKANIFAINLGFSFYF